MTTAAKVGIGLGVTAVLGVILYFSLTGKAEEVVDTAVADSDKPQIPDRKGPTYPLGTMIGGKPTAGTGKGVLPGVATAGGGKGMDGWVGVAGDVWGS